MKNQLRNNRWNAASIFAVTFGVLAGLGGFWHGIGEVQQGNVTPANILIESWATGPVAAYMGGEPGMTVIPNFLITGILCMIVSLAVIIWTAGFVHRRRGGAMLVILSVAMLLVGGGFGPPLMGIIAGIAGTGIRTVSMWMVPGFTSEISTRIARIWPWLFAISAACGTTLVIGSVIAIYFLGVTNGDFFSNLFMVVVVSQIVTMISGVAYDIRTIENKMATKLPEGVRSW